MQTFAADPQLQSAAKSLPHLSPSAIRPAGFFVTGPLCANRPISTMNEPRTATDRTLPSAELRLGSTRLDRPPPSRDSHCCSRRAVPFERSAQCDSRRRNLTRTISPRSTLPRLQAVDGAGPGNHDLLRFCIARFDELTEPERGL